MVKVKKTDKTKENVSQTALPHTVPRSVDWYNFFGKMCSSEYQNLMYVYATI